MRAIVGNSHQLTKQAVATRLHKDQELSDKHAQEKAEREAQEEARRAEILRKQAEATKARKQLERQTKKEMADETRLQLEEKYNKLINATNLNDPSDIIDKFYHMEQVSRPI